MTYIKFLALAASLGAFDNDDGAIVKYTGPDASDCTVCGRPHCFPGHLMFRECEADPKRRNG